MGTAGRLIVVFVGGIVAVFLKMVCLCSCLFVCVRFFPLFLRGLRLASGHQKDRSITEMHSISAADCEIMT